jgi:hypothetical protein
MYCCEEAEEIAALIEAIVTVVPELTVLQAVVVHCVQPLASGNAPGEPGTAPT